MDSTTATSISLSWTNSSAVDSYEVMWQRDTSGECLDEDEGSISLTDGSTSYDIMGLEEDSSYSITVQVTNAAGTETSNSITAMTLEAGKEMTIVNRLCPTGMYPPAPSAAPTSVRVSAVTSSSITVQWGAVDCIHRNGDISGYSVRYGVMGSANIQTMSVSGGYNITEATIFDLTFSTEYSIEVAAIGGRNGIGVYTSATITVTDGEDSILACLTIKAGDRVTVIDGVLMPYLSHVIARV